jgi:hypothetical protein
VSNSKAVEASVTSRKALSRRKQDIFLDLLAQTGSVIESAQAVGFTTTSYLHKLRKEDEDFAERWADAIAAAGDVLEQEAIRRARDGVMDPVFYKGEVVGHKLNYSDQLLMFLMRGNNPEKYNQKNGGDANVNIKFGVAVLPMTSPSDEEWEAKAIAMHDGQELITLEDKPESDNGTRPLSVKRA